MTQKARLGAGLIYCWIEIKSSRYLFDCSVDFGPLALYEGIESS